MKRLLTIIFAAIIIAGGSNHAEAQFFKKLKEKVGNVIDKTKDGITGAYDKTKDGITGAYDKTVDGVTGAYDKTKDGITGAYDKTVDGVTGVVDKTKGGVTSAVDKTKQTASNLTKWARKGDKTASALDSVSFARGEQIVFEDDLRSEALGNFPAKWDINQGAVEVARVNGVKAIRLLENGTRMLPLHKNTRSYLSEDCTVEFDFYAHKQNIYTLHLFAPDDEAEVARVELAFDDEKGVALVKGAADDVAQAPVQFDAMQHLSIWINKGDMLVFINDKCVLAQPCAEPGHLEIEGVSESTESPLLYISATTITHP